MKIKESKYFLILSGIFVLFSGIFMLFFSKAQIAIAINKAHSPFFDIFFKNISFLGTGIIFLPLLIILIIKKKIRPIIISAITVLILMGIVFLLKEKFNIDRPILFFENNPLQGYDFHIVNGVEPMCCGSFPSGHTSTAFASFFLLSAHSFKNKIWGQIIFFGLAFLVGYSRMYLFHHFLIDVAAGAIIGTSAVMLAVLILNIIWKNKAQDTTKSITYNKMKRTLILLFTISCISITSCENYEGTEIVSYFGDSIPHVKVFYKYYGNTKYIAKEVRLYSNGEIESEGLFNNAGQKEGSWKYYYSNSKKWRYENYKNGVKHGEEIEWYKSGKKMYKGEYTKGLPSGEWIVYDEDGKKIEINRYDEKGKLIQ